MKKLLQYTSPFTFNQEISLPSAKYLQIGVEYPYSTPIYAEPDDNLFLLISINEKEYKINPHHTLEFSDLNYEEISIILNEPVGEKNSQYIILDILYEDAS